MPETGIVITSGEPAGIGPDIVAAIEPARFDARLVVVGDRGLLAGRAQLQGMGVVAIAAGDTPLVHPALQK